MTLRRLIVPEGSEDRDYQGLTFAYGRIAARWPIREWFLSVVVRGRRYLFVVGKSSTGHWFTRHTSWAVV